MRRSWVRFWLCWAGVWIGWSGAVAASADTAIRIGSSALRFSWTAAAGAQDGYVVSVSRNGGPLEPYRWVPDTVATVEVAPPETIQISVRAVGRTLDGSYGLGPSSPPSSPVRVFEAPRLATQASWLLQDPVGSRLGLFDLGEGRPSAEGPAPGFPWVVRSVVTLSSEGPLIVWQNVFTGELELWDSDTLAPVPGGVASVPVTTQVAGAGDFDGDGRNELVLLDVVRRDVTFWALGGGGLEPIGSLYPGLPGAVLATVADTNGDGRSELIWHDPGSHRVEAWRLSNSFRLVERRVFSSSAPDGERIVARGDFDGDRRPDLLWRRDDGRLRVWYLDEVVLRRSKMLPMLPDDRYRVLIGAIDVDGVPGDEIAVFDQGARAIEIVLPRIESTPVRWTVLHADPDQQPAGIIP